MKKTCHFQQKYSTVECWKKTSTGCLTCGEILHLAPECWNKYHESIYFGLKQHCKHQLSVRKKSNGAHSNVIPPGVKPNINISLIAPNVDFFQQHQQQKF
eukprot:15332094-Ditylum_brightwellii.AAC.1